MTIYTWPTGRTFCPATITLRVRHNQERYNESPLSGYVQTLALPGSRWGWALDFPATLTTAERSALDALVLRLSGRQHRVQLWDMKRPRPAGDIQLSGVTVGASAAQFATQVALAGCRSSVNLLAGPDFELDSNADGLCDNWLAYTTGTTGTVTRTRVNTTAVGSGFSQTVAADGLGTTDADRAGVVQLLAYPGGTVGTAFTGSAHAWGDVGQKVRVMAQLWAGGVAGQVVLDSGPITTTNTWTRYSASGVATQVFDEVRFYIWQQQRPTAAGAAELHIDKAQLQPTGTLADWVGGARLLAGDWFAAGGQLLICVADAAANDAGTMTVEFRHMLRQALASGAAVTLDKPTGLYILADSATSHPRAPGPRDPGLSLEFVEVFA